MARPKSGEPSKADAIREFLAAQPKAKGKEIIEALEKKGIKVSANHVYLVKSKMRGRIRRDRRDAAVAVASQTTRNSNPVQMVMKVKALAAECGGMKGLKQLVDALAE